MQFLSVNADCFLIELSSLEETLALYSQLQNVQLKGIKDLIPAAKTILVFFNEIEIKFRDIQKITFDALDKSTDFFINIPEGEYKEIELEMDLIDYKNEPSIYFEGKINAADGSSKPFKFEFFGMIGKSGKTKRWCGVS